MEALWPKILPPDVKLFVHFFLLTLYIEDVNFYSSVGDMPNILYQTLYTRPDVTLFYPNLYGCAPMDPRGVIHLQITNKSVSSYARIKPKLRKLWKTVKIEDYLILFVGTHWFRKCIIWKNSPGPFWRRQGRQGQMTSKLKMMKMLYENSFKIDKIQNFRGHGGQMLDFIYF